MFFDSQHDLNERFPEAYAAGDVATALEQACALANESAAVTARAEAVARILGPAMTSLGRP